MSLRRPLSPLEPLLSPAVGFKTETVSLRYREELRGPELLLLLLLRREDGEPELLLRCPEPPAEGANTIKTHSFTLLF